MEMAVLGVGMGGDGRFRDQGWRQVGLGECKVGGVGSRSNHASWTLCSAVRTILQDLANGGNKLVIVCKFYAGYTTQDNQTDFGPIYLLPTILGNVQIILVDLKIIFSDFSVVC